MMPQASRAPLTRANLLDASLATLLCVAALAAWLLSAIPSISSARTGANRFQDDAFYYLVPARHFLEQGRFTFDGVTPTFGFHPLWMAITVATTALVGPDATPEHVVFALNLVEKVLQGIAAALCIAWFLRERDGDGSAAGYLGIALLLLCPYYIVFDQGMETTLAVLLFAASVQALRSDRLARLGALLALLLLCRLDSGIFVGVPLAAYAAWTRRIEPRRAWAIAPVVVAMIAMPLVYLAATGSPVPISGAIKSSFPMVTWHGSYFAEPLNVAAMYGWKTLLYGLNVWLCLLLIAAGIGALAVARLAPRGRNDVLAIAFVGVALVANLLLFQKWEKSVDPRYFALPMAAAMFVLLAGVNGAARGWRSLAPLPVAAVVAAFALESSVLAARLPGSMHAPDDTQRVYRDLARVLPDDAVIAGTDVGALAFWTGRRTINLDGVMNDFEFQKVLRDGKLADYLRRNGVTHIGTALWDAEQTYTARPTEPMYRHQIDPDATHGRPYDCHWFYVHSYVYRVDSDRVCLSSTAEVFRRAMGPMGVGQVSYVVYALPPS